MAFKPKPVKVFYCRQCGKRLACCWGVRPKPCSRCRWKWCHAEDLGDVRPQLITCPRCKRAPLH